MGEPKNPPPTPAPKDHPLDYKAPLTDYFDWVAHGVEKGWITQPDCIHHGDTDPIPANHDEERDPLPRVGEELEYDDPCIVAARFWGPDGPPDS